MSDAKRAEAILFGLAMTAVAMLGLLQAVAETPEADPQLRMLQLCSMFSAALLLVGGFVCLLRMWRPFAVLLMTPLTAWNNAMRPAGDWSNAWESEAITLAMLQVALLVAALIAGAVVYGPSTELTISGVVVAWVFLPTTALLIGVLCRVVGPVVSGMRRAYAETEAELYGQPVDENDERKGALTMKEGER